MNSRVSRGELPNQRLKLTARWRRFGRKAQWKPSFLLAAPAGRSLSAIPLDRSPTDTVAMEERYAVLLNGRKIGTVNLEPTRRGSVTARLAPWPAFRTVSRYRRLLAAAKKRDESYPSPDPTPSDIAAEDGAQAVLESLRLSLAAERSGRPIITKSITLLPEEPPRLRILW